MGRLKKLVGIKSEVSVKYKNIFEVYLAEDADELQRMLEAMEQCDSAGILLIAATDTTIALGKRFGIATMA